MQGEQLKAALARTGQLLRPWEAGLAALLCALVLLVPWPGSDAPIWQAERVETLIADRSSEQEPLWREQAFWRADPGDGVMQLRWRVPDAALTSETPMALALSGPFSADVSFNGQRIGAKGRPFSETAPERAGPIDSLIALPPDLIRPSGNEVSLVISSTRAGYQPAVIVQTLAVTPFRPDARRSLRDYAPTLGLAGVLAVLAISLIRLGLDRGDRTVFWLAGGLAALVIAALAEMSRAYVNYPYDWHQPRQAVILLGMAGFSAGCLGFLVKRWVLGRVWSRAAIGITTAAALQGVLLFDGYDGKIILLTMFTLTGSLIWTLLAGFRLDRNALAMAGVWLALLILNVLAPGRFIDLGVYAITSVALGVWMVRSPDLLSPASEGPAPEAQPLQTALTVQSTGKMHRVALDDVLYLKAAGNYTEVHRCSGGWLLDQRGMAAVLEEAGEGVMRVHRSYAVNMSKVDALLTRPGSRYGLSLLGGAEAPVGRSRVDAVRDALSR
ncbi:LytTR family DNA-binding domain-containing protein [Oceanicaulis alexandrii]|uniref:LytTR family DNA-binding domain-containing protein n=1 Tax=Oceanicaulis alexandrii TaxID=153233 RepID=UPI0035D10693